MRDPQGMRWWVASVDAQVGAGTSIRQGLRGLYLMLSTLTMPESWFP